MLRLKKKDKSPAKDRDRLRKRREGKRRQTAVLAVLRADFTFKFAAAVRACDLAKRLARKSNLSSDLVSNLNLRSNLTFQALKIAASKPPDFGSNFKIRGESICF